ncbi:MAG: hypothetical protein KDA75_21015 [Planctomycetaceae bacterium]|nr:hypothetical protein [Planctomycetaceae bacterium]
MRTLLWVSLVVVGLAGHSVAASRKLAVVVGVDQYRANSDLPDLKQAGSDAAILSAALRSQGYTVYEMTHAVARQPGQENLTPQLEYIRDQIAGVLGFPNLGGRGYDYYLAARARSAV